MVGRAIVVVVAIAALGASCFAAWYFVSKKEKYELAERCGRSANELMKREYEGFVMDDHRHVYNQRNHYNARLNKCFFLLVHLSYSQKRLGDSDMIRELKLIDLHENKDYGWFLGSKERPPTECSVQEKSCRSEPEWFEMVATYMDD